MTINEMAANNNISKYQLAKTSGIPYMTVNDICNGKTNLAECNAKTIYKLSQALGVSMEEIIKPYLIERPSFELFKSNVCHRLKELGDIDFLINTIKSDDILLYYEREWYPEALYLLAMVDYISRVNDVPRCEKYHELRKIKLKETIYSSGVITASAVAKDEKIKEDAVKSSIPEFIRFNIVESEVRNVN